MSTSSTWSLDAAHSHIGFNVRHMMVSKVSGQFDRFTGGAELPSSEWKDANIQFEAEVASISTGAPDRDAHLQSPDFFDAANHPKLSFKSTAMRQVAGEDWEIEGDLEMHGTVKPVKLKAEFGGVIQDPWGNDRAGFHLTGSVNRMDYGLNWNNAIEAGGVVVSENVKFDIDVELVKNKPEVATPVAGATNEAATA